MSLSLYFNDSLGIIFSLLLLSIAAAETSVGLSILVIYYQLSGNINIEFLNRIHG